MRFMRRTTSRMRSSASSIDAIRPLHRAPTSRASSCSSPETTVSGLLISCAAATARLATDRKVVASRSAASARRFSVTSRPIAEAPMTAPDALRSGETVTDTCTRVPVLADPPGLVRLDVLAALEPRQDAQELVGVIGWDDDRDRSPDDLGGRVAVEPLRARVPARDDSLERLADDRVVGVLHDRRQVGQRRLVALALGDDGRDQDAHHCHRAEKRLEQQQRLVRRAVGEGAEAVDGSPDREAGQDRDRERRLTLAEPEGGPHQRRHTEERERLADKAVEHQHAAADDCRDQPHGLQPAQAAARKAAAGAPQYQDRPDDERAHGIPEPPREPDRVQIVPVDAAAERQAGRADRRAQAGGDERREHHELEHVPRPIEDVAPVREEPHEVGAEPALERVADRDADRGEDRTGRRDVHEEGADQDGRPDP
jgi:hypothetical protein